MPTVNYFPEEYTKTWKQDKFVQFTVDSKPFLRLGPHNRYHADIVRQFCEEMGMKFREERRGSVYPSVYPNDSRIELVGMGDIFLLGDQYTYHGSSAGYCLEPNKEHMLRIAAQFPDKRFVSE